MKLKIYLLLISLFILIHKAEAAPKIIFSGSPINKSVNSGLEVQSGEVPTAEKNKYKLVITEEDGKYFWTTRDNNELTRIVNNTGMYVTYVAKNGSGFIRVQDPSATATLHDKIPAYQYDYMEVLLQGLIIITYFGSADN